MAWKPEPGDRVLIELQSNEVYEGSVEYTSPRSIELYNIFCQTTSTTYDGSMTFFRNELIKITPITTSSASGESIEVQETIRMHPDEFQRLKQMTFDYIFVDTYGKQFDQAVEVLSNRESVAVVGLGNSFVKGKGLSLLVVADFKQIFIFDLVCLPDLRGLREVLESDFISKVVHDGTALYDCLYHKYKVEVQNIFDTQVVDSMISTEQSEKNTERNISSCLTHHFNFPSSLLSAALDDMTDKIWHERPVTKSNKVKAAQLVVYLLSMRDKLLGHIMSKYTNSIQDKYNKYKTMTRTELIHFKRK